MKQYIRHLLLATCVMAFLAACGTPKPKAPQVHVAEPEPALEVPPDLFKPEVDGTMAIPKVKNTTLDDFILHRGHVSMQRDGALRWLVIKSKPEAVWEKTLNFWKKAGHALSWKDRKLGIMETEWIVDPDSGLKKKGAGKIVPHRNKFRIRMDRSGKNSIDLYLTHRAQVQTSQGQWRSGRPDPELEVEMMKRLLLFLGVSTSATRSVLNAADGASGASYSKSRNAVVISGGDISRQFRKVSLALDRSGALILDQNEKKRQFLVKYEEKRMTLTLVKEKDEVLLLLKNGGKAAEALLRDIAGKLI